MLMNWRIAVVRVRKRPAGRVAQRCFGNLISFTAPLGLNLVVISETYVCLSRLPAG